MKYIKWIKPAILLLAIVLMFVSAKTDNKVYAMSGAVLLVVGFSMRFFEPPPEDYNSQNGSGRNVADEDKPPTSDKEDQ